MSVGPGDHERPARRRKRPKTIDRMRPPVPALVFPQCSLASVPDLTTGVLVTTGPRAQIRTATRRAGSAGGANCGGLSARTGPRVSVVQPAVLKNASVELAGLPLFTPMKTDAKRFPMFVRPSYSPRK